MIDRIFFRKKYDYQKTLKELSRTARLIAGIDDLLDKILISIVDVIKIKNASAYVLDKRSGKFLLRKTLNPGSHISTLNSEAIEQLKEKKEAVICEDAEKMSADIAGFMKETDSAVIFPIMVKNELMGILSLGEKLSGEVYSGEDIDLLSTLCNQIGVSIENAMLYEDAMEAQQHLYQADKLATLGTLAAGLAHEIKNPIAAIKGFSQVIDKAIEEGDKEVIKDFKDVVPRQLDRINKIVEKLLTLSKPYKIEREQVKINDVLEEIIKLVEKQAMKQRVEIVSDLGGLPDILADYNQLTQAFLNLILNGIQSMPNGGIIRIRTGIEQGKIVVEIADNGIGIPSERLSHIFDPFYTTKDGGSGIGLATTKKTIKDYHGDIRVESEEGKGAVFTVILPV
ncbi:ATP-binding protein [Candidatus Margulisiibacteriota bacterium]